MKRLRNALSVAMFAALYALHMGPVNAAVFTYHGSLEDSGKPAEGGYDLELTLYTSAQGGKAVAGPLLLHQVPVHAGSFSTEADFGPLGKSVEQAWLEVRVRQAGNSEFVSLSSRAAVEASASSLVCPGAWTLDGNAGIVAGTGVGQNYLGTADTQPLIIAVNGVQAGSIAPTLDSAYGDANTITLGAAGNQVGTLGGAVVSGGGTALFSNCGTTGNQPCVNKATGRFATVAGGIGSNALADSATVSGGTNNGALGESAFVGGGRINLAQGIGATVPGGTYNRASGDYSSVVGGYNNFASGAYATIGGGIHNFASGDESFVAGNTASTRDATFAGSPPNCADDFTCGDYLTFVWSGGPGPFTSTGHQQFLVKAIGGIGLNTNSPFANKLTVAGPSGAIASLGAAGNSIALFENNANGYIETAVPVANETGVLFSLLGKTADGGVVYNSSANTLGLSFRTNGNADRMRITSTGATQNTTGSWTTFSDFRLKRDLAAIEHPLDTFLGLHGKTFEYVDPPKAMALPGRRMGFVAQEVEKVLPQWVGEDERGYKMVTPTGFEALSVEALRELRAEKDAEIAALKGKLDVVEARLRGVDALEARLRKLEAAR